MPAFAPAHLPADPPGSTQRSRAAVVASGLLPGHVLAGPRPHHASLCPYRHSVFSWSNPSWATTWPQASRRLADQLFHGTRGANLRTNRRHYGDLPASSFALAWRCPAGRDTMPGDDKYGQGTLDNSMPDTTTREAPDVLDSVRGTSDGRLMMCARAAVGWTV
jgi:hypothetical protein